jgi:hypothetical protein
MLSVETIFYSVDKFVSFLILNCVGVSGHSVGIVRSRTRTMEFSLVLVGVSLFFMK